MSRYIDADKLYELIRTNDYKLATKNGSIDYGMFTAGIKQAIDEQPTADVAEVIRCKDCMFYTPYKLEGYEGLGDCSKLLWLEFCVEDNFFCGYGARMDGMDGETNEHKSKV